MEQPRTLESLLEDKTLLKALQSTDSDCGPEDELEADVEAEDEAEVEFDTETELEAGAEAQQE